MREHTTGTVDRVEAEEYRVRLEKEVRQRIVERGFCGLASELKPKPDPRPSQSYVYLVQAGQSAIKIGIAIERHLAARLESIQTGHHEELQLLALIPGGRKLERELHERFADERIRGEWFRPSERLLEFVRNA